MKRILVAHDGSALSGDVVREGLAIAWRCDGKLRLVRAVDHPSSMLDAAAELSEVARAIPPALRDAIHIDVGGAAPVILAAAKAYGSDLLVVGANRHRDASEVIGTTAVRIVERAEVPVFLVRPRPWIARRGVALSFSNPLP